jgi:hypothetical protein
MMAFKSGLATLKTGLRPTSQNSVSKVVAGLLTRDGAEILSALTHNVAGSAQAEIRYNSQRGRERRVAEPDKEVLNDKAGLASKGREGRNPHTWCGASIPGQPMRTSSCRI